MEIPNPDNLPKPAPDDTDALLAELEREVALDSRMHRRHKWLLTASMLWLLLAIFTRHLPNYVDLLPGFNVLFWGGTAIIFLQQWRRTQERRDLIRKLEGHSRAVGGLMLMILNARKGNYKGVATDILKQTLPALQASDSRYLTPEHLTAMTKLLGNGDTELKLAILKAMRQVGDEQAIPAVEKLTKRFDDLRIREAAEECLPFLRLRAEERQKEMTLLRPSSAIGMAAPETLLRPASATATPDAKEQLLRSAEHERA